MNKFKIALIGNPNVGKTSFFNQLTGLNQKTGNFPGVTVEKKSGLWKTENHFETEVIDLPGTYSLHPKSEDERVVLNYLLHQNKQTHPDCLVLILDQNNLRRNLLLCTQILDLGFPVICCLNHYERAEKNGSRLDTNILKEFLNCPVIKINARTGEGIDRLQNELSRSKKQKKQPFFQLNKKLKDTIQKSLSPLDEQTEYAKYLLYTQNQLNTTHLKSSEIISLQKDETLNRYSQIDKILSKALTNNTQNRQRFAQKIDRIALHPVFGYLLFIFILLIIFQAVYNLSSAPMDFIDEGFASLSEYLGNTLPEGPLTDLITEGIISGIGGILIFIPQITFLFLLLGLLEESGYMSRVMVLMDPIMRKFGLSGRSIIPLVSATACAIPAIMASRTIENPKERIINILVSPLVSCSARLPVYAILIALLFPEDASWGIFNLQGLILMGLYLLGFVTALLFSLIFHFIIKTNKQHYFVMELPQYSLPHWNNIAITVYSKSKSFVFEAGKIILAISIILWALSSYSPRNISNEIAKINNTERLTISEKTTLIESTKLENSYVGILGKAIEPVITPLGYDWKIGIALITSFAAREVFVGTISTIFSIENNDNELTIKEKLSTATNANTGKLVFNTATSVSLLIFYAFAMQCLSTLAITKKETKSWKWPLIQLGYMTALAYFGALITFHFLR